MVLRVSVLLFGALLSLAAAFADDAPSATARTTTLLIWGGIGPGSEDAPKTENFQVYSKNGDRRFWNISRPILTAYYAAKPNGTAVLILPGGGYRVVYSDSGAPVARWLNSLGIDAFVLTYRLPDEGHKAGDSVALQDAQRSLRLIRSGLFSNGHTIDPGRVGVIGFSAGGNLAAVLGIHHNAKVYDPKDRVDQLSARPDFMIMAYPYLPTPGEVSDDPRQPNLIRLYRRFPVGDCDGAPPAFLVHGADDRDVPVRHSERFARALQRCDVPVELHVFAGVGHSFKMDAPGEARVWPDLLAKWLKARGLVP
ncbi:alpha/beta hydrolase [Rhizomicrobium electricum]|uniref:Alpha/beta hydrolase n=1 Tax=Rhizomicrobium electricum TaxID=480070 RepID=A0ABP3P3P9_9PROT|nr:alpha/beta hydrolase [Rhizomicrobium electricum]NIJ47716.1 acetyl esterase/lipase [Rhizomicrobium electricum]